MQEIQKEEEMISLYCSVCPTPSRRLKLHDGAIILSLVAVDEKKVKGIHSLSYHYSKTRVPFDKPT